jgi:hypothetical protein
MKLRLLKYSGVLILLFLGLRSITIGGLDTDAGKQQLEHYYFPYLALPLHKSYLNKE